MKYRLNMSELAQHHTETAHTMKVEDITTLTNRAENPRSPRHHKRSHCLNIRDGTETSPHQHIDSPTPLIVTVLSEEPIPRHSPQLAGKNKMK